ncbi:hypothetical protein [Thalassobius sp. I31.1]|uniref:hypothetical protein n=1 Tax=Thalassobius sp. I31.1 TaxID=2109912 RepID=UPI00130037E7|nr:hypothetical protein [Thalassobius sp. I31.1]
MTIPKNARETAAPIGRNFCFETGEEIGLLYQWSNGETQVTLYSDWDVEHAMSEFESQE